MLQGTVFLATQTKSSLRRTNYKFISPRNQTPEKNIVNWFNSQEYSIAVFLLSILYTLKYRVESDLRISEERKTEESEMMCKKDIFLGQDIIN